MSPAPKKGPAPARAPLPPPPGAGSAAAAAYRKSAILEAPAPSAPKPLPEGTGKPELPDEPNLEDREYLVTECLPLVKFIAHRIGARLPAHVEVDDLIHSGDDRSYPAFLHSVYRILKYFQRNQQEDKRQHVGGDDPDQADESVGNGTANDAGGGVRLPLLDPFRQPGRGRGINQRAHLENDQQDGGENQQAAG